MKSLIASQIINCTKAVGFVMVCLYSTASLAAPTVRYYSAGISPITATAGGTSVQFTVTIRNCASGTEGCGSNATTSTQNIGSASVSVPSGFSGPTGLSTAAPSSKTWTATYDDTSHVIILGASGGTSKLTPGQSMTVSFYTNVPCDTTNPYTWTTAAYQDTLSSGQLNTTTPYTLAGSQPSVTVTGSCAAFTGWQSGDYCTTGQGGWGATPNGNNPGKILQDNFGSAYPSGVTVGTTPNYNMKFTTPAAVDAYLPATKGPAALSQNYTDPKATTSGEFGGQVLALRFNVDLNGALGSTMSDFSSIVLKNTGSSLDGASIAAILQDAQTALGGGALPSGYTISELNNLIDAIDNAFGACVPTEWAQNHLEPASP